VYGRTRLDWAAKTDKYSFQADLQHSTGARVESPALLAPPYRALARRDVSSTMGNVVLSWTRAQAGGVESSLQGYYSGFGRAELSETAHTVDLDARQRRHLGSRHDLVAGIGYRSIVGTVAPERSVRMWRSHGGSESGCP
jgi:hypothetical protein